MKKASISFVLLVSLVVLCAGASILSMAVSSKYNSVKEYQRIQNRYISESGIDLAVGLFMNYLSNQDYVLTYTKNENDSFCVIDDYAPYLLDEIRLSDNSDEVPIDLVATESSNYLTSVGFLDFSRGGSIEVSFSTFNLKEEFKLSRMCVEVDFMLSQGIENENKHSKINPIYLTVKSKYKGGETLCNVEISDLYIVREPFCQLETEEMGSVSAGIDVTSAKVTYENYQNYRGFNE
ncbi:MAG: hypothetical protein EOM23_03955 [Candidatus Moranbacteria bacterium]|nr:hypothetical protein [Candidatus Moranbacteria bacterium]